MAKGSLVAHRKTQHGVLKGVLGQVGNKEVGDNDPIIFRIAFPEKSGPRTCPVEEYSGLAVIGTAMRMKFWHRNFRDTVVILEEGNLPHPQCPICDMMLPWRSLSRNSQRTAQCSNRADRKRRRLAAEKDQ